MINRKNDGSTRAFLLLLVLITSIVSTCFFSDLAINFYPGFAHVSLDMALTGAYFGVMCACNGFASFVFLSAAFRTVDQRKNASVSASIDSKMFWLNAMADFIAFFFLLYFPFFLTSGFGIQWPTDPEGQEMAARSELLRPWVDNPVDAIWIGSFVYGVCFLCFRIGMADKVRTAKIGQRDQSRYWFAAVFFLQISFCLLVGSHLFYAVTKTLLG